MFKLIILDRDGVINQDRDDFVKSPDEWIPIPGSLEAIAKLNQAGMHVVIATNQSGVARGYFDEETLGAIHEKMYHLLAEKKGSVEVIYYCPHGPDDNCDCRKPKSGMYLKALGDFNVAPEEALVVGDSLRDIQAAHAAGCSAALVKTGKGERTLEKSREELQSCSVFNNLDAVVCDLLG